ncbi:MAG: SRPBCC family protein [Nannocystaceae bacterium]
MKILKRILIGLVALVALLLVVGLFLPSKWRVERTIAIGATPEAIAPLLATPRRWADWAAWNNQMDPTLVTTYGGPETGVGASMTWKGESMGHGTMTITSVAPTVITYDLVLEENQTPAHGTFSLSVEGDKTMVTWLDEGDMGMFIPGRYFRPLLEKMLGEHFELGLKKLQPLAESEARAAGASSSTRASAEPPAAAGPPTGEIAAAPEPAAAPAG